MSGSSETARLGPRHQRRQGMGGITEVGGRLVRRSRGYFKWRRHQLQRREKISVTSARGLSVIKVENMVNSQLVKFHGKWFKSWKES